MKKQGLLLCLVCVLMFFSLAGAGCKESSEAQLSPTGVLLEYNGCKQTQNNRELSSALYDTNSDCIEYQYDGRSTLMMTHINGGFNCCPGEITAVIECNGNVITVTEQEREQACRCMCLFDMDYRIENLQAGEYTIRIVEPYVEGGDQVLEFTLQLSSATSGNFCLQRTYYPWGQ